MITSETLTAANEYLDTIEAEYDVSIALAVAHGSHAWGLDNENSDYDIKAIYVPNSLNQYAHIGSHNKTINRTFGDFEIEGWDIQKFASLLSESNEQALDVLRSPIVYQVTFDRTPLRKFIEEAYNPIQLYHCYRSIANNNYRKYLSDHLTSNRNTTYPIIERRDDGMLVYNEYADTELYVPHSVIDSDDAFIDIAFDELNVDKSEYQSCPNCDSSPGSLPTKFQTTQTKRTVKRNLAVMRASMHAYYLKATGEDSKHELPHVSFPTFLEDQAPAVFDQNTLETAWSLVKKKQDGNNEIIGDEVGRDFAHPPQEIDPEIHATNSPDQPTLNEFIDIIIDETL